MLTACCVIFYINKNNVLYSSQIVTLVRNYVDLKTTTTNTYF